MLMYLFITFFFGLIIGSMLNVCIHRIPQNKSIAFPASHCPKCLTPLRPFNLIPVISFLLQRGRCSYCGNSILWRYPLVELLTGMLYTFTFYSFGFSIETMIYFIMIPILIVISFIDLDLKIIPNRIIIFGLIVGFLINIISPLTSFLGGIIGFLSGGSLFLAIAIISKGGMGGGDIKLAAMIGLWLGWQQAMLGFFLAFLIGAVVGLGLVAIGLKTRKDAVPFGPFIALGTLISIFWGEHIVNWYLSIYF